MGFILVFPDDVSTKLFSSKLPGTVHAHKPTQWSWTTRGGHTWGGVWDGNGGMRTIM